MFLGGFSVKAREFGVAVSWEVNVASGASPSTAAFPRRDFLGSPGPSYWRGSGGVPGRGRSRSPPSYFSGPALICTVAVIPLTSRTPSGTRSMWMRTGTRCASRTQVKIGFTEASPV